MWDRLWVIARVELLLTDAEFLGYSYRQFSLLHDRYLNLRWQDQWQQGAIAAAVYRSGMRTFDPVPKPDDFIFTMLPGQKHRHPSTKRKRNTKAKQVEIANLFRAIAGVRAK
jgi:hypothetical protein